MIAVLSAIFGNYDTVKPAPHPDSTLVCDSKLMGDVRGNGWRLCAVGPDAGMMPPVLRAKAPKMLPWFYVDADVVLWVDGAAQLDQHAVEGLVRAAGDAPVAMFRHPFRDCIYEEADASIGKYPGDNPHARVDRYREAGHPAHWGLWSTGVIVWRSCAVSKMIGDRWHLECMRGSAQDQVSLPVILREVGIKPATLPGDVYENEFITWHPHNLV